MDDVVEVIGIEHLKVILSGLSPEEIIRPAYENWQTCMKTGYTRLNLETGEIYVAGDGTRRNIGLSALLKANENGFLSIGKDAE